MKCPHGFSSPEWCDECKKERQPKAFFVPVDGPPVNISDKVRVADLNIHQESIETTTLGSSMTSYVPGPLNVTLYIDAFGMQAIETAKEALPIKVLDYTVTLSAMKGAEAALQLDGNQLQNEREEFVRWVRDYTTSDADAVARMLGLGLQ